jgi:hypothetical protein
MPKTVDPQTALKARLKVLYSHPSNATCVDCPERSPRWASIIPNPGTNSPLFANGSVGCLMCLECSGSHRRLGVHVAFVRSITLDTWKESEVEAMERGGNDNINHYYMAQHPGYQKANGVSPDGKALRFLSQGASGQERERFIREKYDKRR